MEENIKIIGSAGSDSGYKKGCFWSFDTFWITYSVLTTWTNLSGKILKELFI